MQLPTLGTQTEILPAADLERGLKDSNSIYEISVEKKTSTSQVPISVEISVN